MPGIFRTVQFFSSKGTTRMKKLISALLLLLCSWLQAQPKLAKVTILHWNDFHAANEPFSVTIRDTGAQKDSSYLVGGIASFLGYLNKERNESPSPIVLNAGDDFQGTPISSITFGRSQIELMNIVRPDAMTLGNQMSRKFFLEPCGLIIFINKNNCFEH